jgi:hypothetical protein
LDTNQVLEMASVITHKNFEKQLEKRLVIVTALLRDDHQKHA